MLKIGLLILLNLNQPQTAQDSLGFEELIKEQQIENQLLEKEVELLNEHVKEIRNTVWFSLGVILTVLMAIVFYNWFTTNKLYEKDKQRLIDLIKEDMSNSLSKLSSENQKELLETEKFLSGHLDKQIINLETFKVDLSSLLGHNYMDDSRFDEAATMYGFTLIEFIKSDLQDHKQLDLVVKSILEIYNTRLDELSDTSKKMIGFALSEFSRCGHRTSNLVSEVIETQ